MQDLIRTIRIRLYGIVQGVGFRPFVSRAAMKGHVTGSVCNRGSYVEVIARGREQELEAFLETLRTTPPERAVILKIDVRDTQDRPDLDSFQIVESEKEKGDIFISPDIATCPSCRQELFDRKNRRYLHPFINCTQCGPRLTILDELPYDRDRTSMKEFPMCPACAEEYHNPASRRYDAQPVCCNDCGPEVFLVGRKERGADAISEARRMLAAGKILAVKGIGGFHLCCDATSQEAVMRLRDRKKRPVKPFAVMMRDEETVLSSCYVNDEQKRILTGYQKPILLLEKRDSTSLCEAVAPGNPKVGVMLPYAPVQMLLFDYPDEVQMPDCLVMTSGNVSGAPICKDEEEAVRELGAFVDAILSHDRKIRIRCDDSVMDFEHGRPYMIRRSRGYAPLPVLTGGDYDSTVLAVGGELKNTFCLGIGSMFYPSAYVGDLADPRSVRALQESIDRMETLLEKKASLVACDLHPAYHSTEVAGAIAKERGIRVIPIQHHFAHIVSCMAENDLDGEVLGASFDGTGWGTDGTIWGGELMLTQRGGFDRFGSIRPFRMVGGDLASKEGWRVACSMLHDLYPDMDRAKEICEGLSLCSSAQFQVISRMSDSGMNTVRSTSAGRLFDAVSAILGICRSSTFEGEASTALQFSAERYRKLCGDVCHSLEKEGWYDRIPENERRYDEIPGNEKRGDGIPEDERRGDEIPENERRGDEIPEDERRGDEIPENERRDDGILKGSPVGREDQNAFTQLPTDLLVKKIIEEKLKGTDRDELAFFFHKALARMTARAILDASKRTGQKRAVLSGGVFQNTLLLDLTSGMLTEGGMQVYTHHLIPPNDGGISLGQALAAQEIFRNTSRRSQESTVSGVIFDCNYI